MPNFERKGIKFSKWTILVTVMHMKIGLPKALLYYRYGTLWETFFRELQFDVEISADTNKGMLKQGTKHALDENCLPLKIFIMQQDIVHGMHPVYSVRFLCLFLKLESQQFIFAF